MKSQLPALVRPIPSTSHGVQPLADRPALGGMTSHNADCANDAASVFNDSYGNGDSGLHASASADQRIYHAAPLVRTKKKRFG
jgi:hypothetical protein